MIIINDVTEKTHEKSYENLSREREKQNTAERDRKIFKDDSIVMNSFSTHSTVEHEVFSRTILIF
jgi:hypothetical protein